MPCAAGARAGASSVEDMTPTDPPTSPRTAVIVPAYQAERFVAETLRTIQAQTVTDWECIVVDDGSRDGTARAVEAVAAADPRITLVRRDNGGVASARNLALSKMSAAVQYVAFVDADDLWCEDALERLTAALEVSPDAVGAYGYAELVDEHGSPLSPGLHPSRQRDRRRLVGRRLQAVGEMEPLRFAENVVVGPIWPPAVALHRRRVVDLVGGFDPEIRQADDWDYYVRMSRHGDFVPVGRRVASYRQHANNLTSQSAENAYFTDVTRRKTWESPLNTPEQRLVATRAWRQMQWRRTARTAQRLLAALGHRRWDEVPDLLRGTVVLAAQNLAAGPPVARREHVLWARRTL